MSAAITLPEQCVPTHCMYLPQGLLLQGTATSMFGAGERLSWEMSHQQCFCCRVYFQGYFLTSNVVFVFVFWGGSPMVKVLAIWQVQASKLWLIFKGATELSSQTEQFLHARMLSTVP